MTIEELADKFRETRPASCGDILKCRICNEPSIAYVTLTGFTVFLCHTHFREFVVAVSYPKKM